MITGRIIKQVALIGVLTLKCASIFSQEYASCFSLSVDPKKSSLIQSEPLMCDIVFTSTGDDIPGQVYLPDLKFRDDDIHLIIVNHKGDVKTYNSWEQMTSDSNYHGPLQPLSDTFSKSTTYTFLYNWHENEFIFEEPGNYILTFTVRVSVVKPDQSVTNVFVEADPVIISVESTPSDWKPALNSFKNLDRIKYSKFWEYQSPEKMKKLDEVINYCSDTRRNHYRDYIAASLGAHLAAMETVSAASKAAHYLEPLVETTDKTFPLRKEILYFGSISASQVGETSKAETWREILQRDFPDEKVAGKRIPAIKLRR